MRDPDPRWLHEARRTYEADKWAAIDQVRALKKAARKKLKADRKKGRR